MNIAKKCICLLLTAIMVLAAGPLAGFSGLTERAGLTAPTAQAGSNEGGSGSGDSGTGSGATLQVGDVIEFGTYPQTRVTDRYFVNSLDAFSESLPEKNYGYTYNENKTLNMVYKDFFYQGVKYRGVKIGQYRPTTIDNSASEGNSFQDENGYELNKWYYFKYEPLRWTVLDPEQGLVFCNSVIDSQIYHTKNNGCYPFAKSAIKKWLDNTFFDAAFSREQQSNIESVELFAPAFEYNYYHYSTGAVYYLLELDKDQYMGPKSTVTDYALSQSYNDNRGQWIKDLGSYNDIIYDLTASSGHEYASYYGDYGPHDAIFDPINYNDWWSPDVNPEYPIYYDEMNCELKGSSYKKRSYHWAAPCDHFDVPVGDYHVLRGIRPVLYLKSFLNDTAYSGYLPSSDSLACEMRVTVMGQGTVTGNGFHMAGERFTITATPAEGWTFDAWYYVGPDDPATAPSPWETEPTRTGIFPWEGRQCFVEARFKQLATVTLNTAGAGSGRTANSSSEVQVGGEVIASAYPDSGSYFMGWYDKNGELVSRAAQYAHLPVTEAAVTYTARFGLATQIERVSIENMPVPHIGSAPNTSLSGATIADGADYFTLENATLRWYKQNTDGSYTEMTSSDRFQQGGSYKYSIWFKMNADLTGVQVAGNATAQVNGRTVTLSHPYSNNYVMEDSSTYANFYEYTLTVNCTGGGSGTVTGERGKMIYGTPIELTATPAEGSYFYGWYTLNTDGTPQTVDPVSTDWTFRDQMMYRDRTVVAQFEKEPIESVYLRATLPKVGDQPNINPVRTYTKLGWKVDEAYVTDVNSPNLAWGDDAFTNLTIEAGRSYYLLFYLDAPGRVSEELTVEPDFSVYTGEVWNYQQVTKKIDVDPIVAYVGTYSCVVAVPFVGGATEANHNGLVLVDGDCETTGSGVYPQGEQVTVTAAPGDDQAFVGWYDAEAVGWEYDETENDYVLVWPAPLSTNPSYTFTAGAFHSLYARCEDKQGTGTCHLTLTTTGSGTVTGAGTYAEGDPVTITATPAAGCTFVGWFPEGNTVGTGNPDAQTSFSAPGEDMTIEARFAKELSASDVTLSWTSKAYNGAVQKPTVTVTNAAGQTLVKNTDYTVAYSAESKTPGTYKVTVTGKGNYTGTITKTYTITKQALSADNMTLEWTSAAYNGTVQQPKVTLKNAADSKMTEGISYTVVYSADSKYPGSYKVTVTGKGYYSGTASKTYTITKQPLDVSRMTLSKTSFIYNGAVQKPTATVKNVNGYAMTEGSSYTVSYSADSKVPGTYTVTVTGKGYYNGSASKTYTITKQPLDASRMTLSKTSFIFNDAVQKPTVTVKNVNGYAMTEGSSYTITYSADSKVPGSYTVTATGKGYYTGSISKTYSIVPAQVKNLKAVTVDDNKATLTWDAVPGAEKYMVYYATSKNGTYTAYTFTSGTTYTMSRTGAGSYFYKVRAFTTVNDVRYYGAFSSVVRTVPGQVKNLKAVTVDANKATLTWDAVPGAEKYMIYYATAKDGTYTAYSFTSGTTYTMSRTGAGSYFYKVRAFVTANDVRYYGAFSSVVRTVPGQVKNLKAVTVDANKATLTWDAVPGAEKYMIYYATAKDGTYTAYSFTSGTTYTMSRTGAGSYFYKVRAFVTANDVRYYGAFSSVVHTVPGQVKNLKATKVNANKASLSWTAVPGAEKYMVYYATAKNGTYTAYTFTSGTTYTMSRTGAGSYYYKVRAFTTADDVRYYGAYSAITQAK